ncbi:HlyD family efflux transporter periplasmic adaptor subunit [Exiguobacterium antarcticum]|uniref:HlyD family efflux transporter periplasmic adaptor subunit n=1 Tax=Exiguobacterium antarcticum TaxID=132920 RepID=A0ABT6R676_9BACL|nr:HlyD family efflux transporter periplasmic adaptor subunit [Exiguobacterium antarcticum]MDI3235784.1 HlyD family efflux transporter periplasmic adaptor subunit [Exiguobacterium antarcticum]
MKQTKKRTKWWIGLLVMLLIGTAGIAAMGQQSSADGLKREKVEQKTLQTYYHFTGQVEAKNRSTVASNDVIEVKTINVEAGQQVKAGETLLTTVSGETYQAAITGEVAKLDVEENTSYGPNTTLAVITDYDELTVQLKVDEQDINRIEPDQPVELSLTGLEETIPGTVAFVGKEAVNENGLSYFAAEVTIDEPKNLRVGMTVEARIDKQLVKEAPVLSLDVVQYTESDRPYVYVEEEDDVVRRFITTGVTDGQDIEIKKGLTVGDFVVLPTEEGSSGLLPTPPGGAS